MLPLPSSLDAMPFVVAGNFLVLLIRRPLGGAAEQREAEGVS